MENQEYYFDVSYQRSKDGPVGMIYLPDIGSVMEWMQKNGESIHFALLLKMPGNADGLVGGMRWKADLRGLQNLRTPWLLCWPLSQRRTHRGI